MSRRVLMVAYHFPPFAGSTGFLRTLSFARYLPDHGWTPVVLSVNERAYPSTNPKGLDDIPTGLVVHRAFALEVRRHLSIRGYYPRWFATPDPWNTWIPSGVTKAVRLIRDLHVDVLWTTYPIASAIVIGMLVKRYTGIPWILDLRDPLFYDAWPTDPWQRKVHGWLERKAVRTADRVVVTTPGAVRIYQQRYPDIPRQKWMLIPNGYDEALFSAAQSVRVQRTTGAPLLLLHSGALEMPDRDPTAFFQAVADLLKAGEIAPKRVEIVLRASGHTELYRRMIQDRGIGDVVRLEGVIPYRDAVAEMLSADALLLFQGRPCNNQIPAKVYEYLASGRPILAMTDAAGDTRTLLLDAGASYLVDMADPEEIARMLRRFLRDAETGASTQHVPSREVLERYSRRTRSAELASMLDDLYVGNNASGGG